LLIGDPALDAKAFRLRARSRPGLEGFDRLPFVFAVWVARPGACTHATCLLLQAPLEAGCGAQDRAGVGARAAAIRAPDYMNARSATSSTSARSAGLREFLRPQRRSSSCPPTELRFVGEEHVPELWPHRRTIDDLLEHAARRPARSEAMRLGDEAPLHELRSGADSAPAQALHPTKWSYIVDRSINYTNVHHVVPLLCLLPAGRARRGTCCRATSWRRRSRNGAAGGIRSCCRAASTPRCTWSGTRTCSAG
jgi:hypothetical protein